MHFSLVSDEVGLPRFRRHFPYAAGPSPSDNGRAQTDPEIKRYFRQYRRRAMIEFILYELQQESMKHIRDFLPKGTFAGDLARKLKSAATQGWTLR